MEKKHIKVNPAALLTTAGCAVLLMGGVLLLKVTGPLEAVPLTGRGAALQNSRDEEYLLYIGLNDKETYRPVLTAEEAREKVGAICARYVDGYTIQTAEGGWRDGKGNLTREITLICSIHDASEEQIEDIMDQILVQLNQDAVLLEKKDTLFTYYKGNAEKGTDTEESE